MGESASSRSIPNSSKEKVSCPVNCVSARCVGRSNQKVKTGAIDIVFPPPPTPHPLHPRLPSPTSSAAKGTYCSTAHRTPFTSLLVTGGTGVESLLFSISRYCSCTEIKRERNSLKQVVRMKMTCRSRIYRVSKIKKNGAGRSLADREPTMAASGSASARESAWASRSACRFSTRRLQWSASGPASARESTSRPASLHWRCSNNSAPNELSASF